ncbi:MAG: glucosyltransferase domain-containing protein, partial [Clostridia bacterium]|nr:glucosyltransferase domain-containing protein [Clostridia bacterium]
MKTFFKDFKNFALNPKFIIPLILSVALGYGYVLNHFAIGIDDLTRPRYIQGELIAQGRLSGTLISYLFGYTEYRPFWEDFVSILFIILAAFVAAIFLKRITKDRVHPHVYTFFACFLATYPIINEIFLYAGSGLNMGIGYALTFIAAILMEDFFEKKKWYTIAFCTLIFIFNISMYESFVFVYSCCVCGVLTIKQLMADEIFPQINQTKNQKSQEKLPLKKIITQILWYILPLILGFVFEYIISAGVRSFLNLETSTNAASYIVFPPKIREVITFSVYRYIFNGLWYLPITILVISGIVMLIITARNCIRCKTPVYLLYTAGMFLSVLALPILQSGEIKYRTSQSLVMFCIFPLTLLLQKCLCGKSKIKQYTTIAVSLLLILAQ